MTRQPRERKPAVRPAISRRIVGTHGTRERIDETAYRLFSRDGIRGVGVDTICAESGVAKMTLYRHYATKTDLALSFLRQRTELFSRPWQQDVNRRARSARGRLLAVFDALDDWFQQKDYAGCPVIKAMLETNDARDPVRKGTIDYFAELRDFIERLALQAGVADPPAIGRQWMILIKGAVVVACAGDRNASRRAKEMAALLLRKGRARRG